MNSSISSSTILLLLFLINITIITSSITISAAPTTSPLDPDGKGYTLNFTAFFDYPADGDTQPSFTNSLGRTAVITIEYEVDRPLAVLDDVGAFSHNHITTVGMAIKNSTTDFVDDTATAGLDYSKIYKHLTLNVSDSAHSDRVKVTTNGDRTATTIWAQFILPIMDWDAAEDDIYWATEYFHVITTGLPPGTNFSKINSIRFQMQKMNLLRVYTTPTNRNYNTAKTACENAYPGQNAFLATLLRKDESASFLSDSGARTAMDASNTLRYWIGATVFDDKTKDRNLCWTNAPYYDSEICNTATHPDTARNNTIFTYASSPSSWNTNEIFCSRQRGFECTPSNLGNAWRSLSTGSPSTGTTNSLRTYAAAMSYDATNFQWVYGLYDATSSNTNFGAICVNLTSIGSWGSNYFVPKEIDMDALNIVPPNTATVSFSKTKTVSDESETASKNITESKSANTDSFSASFTNETETPSDALTPSKTRTLSKVPTPSQSHEETSSVTESRSESSSESFSKTESESFPTPERTLSNSTSESISQSLTGGTASSSSSHEITLSTSRSLSQITFSETFSHPPERGYIELMNSTFQIPFSSVGPPFIGLSRASGEEQYTTAQTTPEASVSETSRPLRYRTLAYRVSSPSLLVLNTSATASSCFLLQRFDGDDFGTGDDNENNNNNNNNNPQSSTDDGWFTNPATTLSGTAAQLELRRAASKWIFDRIVTKVVSPKEITISVPIIPNWAVAKQLFGAEAGNYVLELENYLFEPVKVRARLENGCFWGAIAQPPPTVRFEVLPPKSEMEPSLALAQNAQHISRALAFFLSPIAFFPQAATMHVSRTAYGLHMAQCLSVPPEGPTVFEYPLRFAIGSESAMLDLPAERASSTQTSESQISKKARDDNRVLSQYMGATIGNFAFLFLIFVIGGIACHIYVIQKNEPIKIAKAQLRYPSMWVIVPMFLFMDVIARGASIVVFSGQNSSQTGLGVIIITILIVLLAVGYFALRMKVRTSGKLEMIFHRMVKATAAKRHVVHFVWGSYKWRDMLICEVDEAEADEVKKATGESELEANKTTDNNSNNNSEEKEDSFNNSSSSSHPFLQKVKDSISNSSTKKKTFQEKLNETPNPDEEGIPLAEKQKRVRIRKEMIEEAATPTNPGFTHRNGRFFRPYFKRDLWFAIFDMFIIMFFGFLSGIRYSQTACAVSGILFCVTATVYLVLVIVRRPYISTFDFTFTILLSIFNLLIGVLLVYGFLASSYSMRLLAVELIGYVQFLLWLKILIDFGLFFLHRKFRKERIFEEELIAQQRALMEGMSKNRRIKGQSMLETMVPGISSWYNQNQSQNINEDGFDELAADHYGNGEDNNNSDEQDGNSSNKLGDEIKQTEDEDGFTIVDVGKSKQNPRRRNVSFAANLENITEKELENNRRRSINSNNDDDDDETDDDDEEAIAMLAASREEKSAAGLGTVMTSSSKAATDKLFTTITKCPKEKWVPDEAVSSCNICDSEFTFTIRRHHCRACGSLCCASCTPHTNVSMYDPVEVAVVSNQRCCKLCYSKANDEKTRDEHAEEVLFPELETIESKKLMEKAENMERKQMQTGEKVGGGDNDEQEMNEMMLTKSGSGGEFLQINDITGDENNNNNNGENNNDDSSSLTRMPRMAAREDWHRDEDYDMCARCDCEFTTTVRKHHCRACKKIFCKNCCSALISMLSVEGDQVIPNQRCCVRCVPKKVIRNQRKRGDTVKSILLGGAGLLVMNNSSGGDNDKLLQEESIWSMNSSGRGNNSNNAALSSSLNSNSANSNSVNSNSSNSNNKRLSAKQQAAERRKAALKHADDIAESVLRNSTTWLPETRMELGRDFDRDAAILDEKMQRDAGVGKGFLFRDFKMSYGMKRYFKDDGNDLMEDMDLDDFLDYYGDEEDKKTKSHANDENNDDGQQQQQQQQSPTKRENHDNSHSPASLFDEEDYFGLNNNNNNINNSVSIPIPNVSSNNKKEEEEDDNNLDDFFAPILSKMQQKQKEELETAEKEKTSIVSARLSVSEYRRQLEQEKAKQERERQQKEKEEKSRKEDAARGVVSSFNLYPPSKLVADSKLPKRKSSKDDVDDFDFNFDFSDLNNDDSPTKILANRRLSATTLAHHNHHRRKSATTTAINQNQNDSPAFSLYPSQKAAPLAEENHHNDKNNSPHHHHHHHHSSSTRDKKKKKEEEKNHQREKEKKRAEREQLERKKKFLLQQRDQQLLEHKRASSPSSSSAAVVEEIPEKSKTDEKGEQIHQVSGSSTKSFAPKSSHQSFALSGDLVADLLGQL